MVSVLAFYSDDPSSIPAEVYNFSVKLLLKRTKINKKRPGLAQFKKKKKNFFGYRPVQMERVICSRIGRFNSRVKRGLLQNSLSYCILCSKLRRSKLAFSTTSILYFFKRGRGQEKKPKLTNAVYESGLENHENGYKHFLLQLCLWK